MRKAEEVQLAKEGGGVQVQEEGDGGVAPALPSGGTTGVVVKEKIYRGLNRALREQGMIPADRGVGDLERGEKPEFLNASIDSSFDGSKDEVNRSENGTYESVHNYDTVCNN